MGGLFGQKPTVPKWTSLDLGKEQAQATANNIAMVPEAAKLAGLTEDQIINMLRREIPGFDEMRLQATKNINAELKGEIPQDVQDAIYSSAAAKSLGGGFAGSGLARNLVARDLGLTSLGLMDRGLRSAESWIAQSERMLAPAMGVFTRMFVSPQQQAAFDVNERDRRFEYQWLKNQIAAMPNPGAVGTATIATAFGTGGLSAYMSGGKNFGQAGQPAGGTPSMSLGGGLPGYKSGSSSGYSDLGGWGDINEMDLAEFGGGDMMMDAGQGFGLDMLAMA